MKTFEEDTKLREIIRDIKLESPDKDFTMNVLDRIHKEVPFSFQIKKDTVLGKPFWIFIALFVVLLAVVFAQSPEVAGSEGVIGRFFDSLKSDTASSTYKGILSNIYSIPLGVTGILMASSLLIFLERFLSVKLKQ